MGFSSYISQIFPTIRKLDGPPSCPSSLKLPQLPPAAPSKLVPPLWNECSARISRETQFCNGHFIFTKIIRRAEDRFLAVSADLCSTTLSIRDPSSGLSAWLRLTGTPPRLSGDIHPRSSHLRFITGQDCCERQSVSSINHLSANRLVCLSQILQRGLRLTLLLIYFRIRYTDTPPVQIHMFLVSMHLNSILKN